MINFIKQKQKGSILAFAVIIMSFLMIIAIGLVASSLLSRKGTNVSSNSTSAFQNTDKGMELFLYELYTNTKPYNNLEELASSIVDSNGDQYTCDDSSGVAIITGSEFDVVSYKEANPNDNNGLDYTVATSCIDTEIARVYKIKVTGHFATASRSIEVNLSNSLKRGRISKWNFEGNAESLRLYGKVCGSSGEDFCAGAPVVKDRSQNDYILTLCPIDEDSSLPNTADFSDCPRRGIEDVPSGEIFFHHMPKWYTASIFDLHDEWVRAADVPNGDDMTCRQIDKADEEETENISPCGGYVPGVVNDDPGEGNEITAGTGRPIDPNSSPNSDDYYDYDKTGYRVASEALEFNGTSQYLAPNVSKERYNGNYATNYVKEGARDGLNLKDSEGLSLSLWVNDNSETGDDIQVLVYKVSGSNGYALFLQDGKIHFQLNGREFSADFDSDSWHHVVARYDNDLGRGDILIDGEVVGSGLNAAGKVRDGENIPLFIGSEKGDDKYFGGMIDNVEIYNRYLINFEVQKLCNMAEGEGWQANSGSKIDDLCKDIVW